MFFLICPNLKKKTTSLDKTKNDSYCDFKNLLQTEQLNGRKLYVIFADTVCKPRKFLGHCLTIPIQMILNQKPVIKNSKRSEQNFLKHSFHDTRRIFIQIKNCAHTDISPHRIASGFVHLYKSNNAGLSRTFFIYFSMSFSRASKIYKTISLRVRPVFGFIIA